MLSAFACGCLFPLASSSMASHPFACNCAPGLCQIICFSFLRGRWASVYILWTEKPSMLEGQSIHNGKDPSGHLQSRNA
jgi:hypothetical protein